ncbi:MAG TPA: trypsin-like peptidase domain-containing protein [Actinomycetota bacterium]|nr:trypsin-like peptidase domain-containing protein [Actinomycetota bacterium]
MNRQDPRKTVASLVLVALAAAGCSIESVPDGEAGAAPEPAVTLAQRDRTVPHSPLSEIVEAALPSVVNVRVKSFDVTGFDSGGGSGSGVIIDEKGIVLTNFHVVQGAAEVNVRIFSGDEHEDVEGEVIGGVPEQDLAIIRIDKDGLVPMEIGRSADLKLGDDVVAIGYPLGLGGATVTAGIVSAIGRSITASNASGDAESLQNLLQTDAAINPGNSGGPLIDTEGRLVGINTAAVQAGAAENIGFSIPIDDALPVVEEILSDPPDERAWLGVTLGDASPSAALEFGFPSDTEGALVLGVVPDSPSDEAGLSVGDVIVEIDGENIRSADDLIDVLRDKDPGETVELEIVDATGEGTVEVELEQRPVTLG